jgi:NADPH-dependent curcumin reductase CurA
VLAGAADKRRFAIEDTAFDACIERRAPDLEARLRAACPNGIDVYFENAGGAVFNTVLPLLNRGARVPLRGTIVGREGAGSSESEVRLWYLARTLAAKRIKMQAFIVSDHRHRYGEFVQQMSYWLDSGKVKFREDIVDGLENAGRAFVSLVEGGRFGRLVIRVANR